MAIPNLSPQTAGIATGTTTGTKFLRDDMTWQVPTSTPSFFWGAISNSTEIAITAATTATIGRMHVVSGTSADYTITLPAASSNSGSVIGFRVKDFTAASKQFTLDAGATVKIVGRTQFLVLLHTNVLLLISDGTDWQPLVCHLDTPWVDVGAVTISGVTTNPTKGGGSPALDKLGWRRSGRNIECVYRYYQTTAGAAGSGAYYLTIPIGTMDTARYLTWNGTDIYTVAVGQSAIGRFNIGINGVASARGEAVIRSTTTVSFLYNGSPDAAWSSTNFPLSFAAMGAMSDFTVPMVNW